MGPEIMIGITVFIIGAGGAYLWLRGGNRTDQQFVEKILRDTADWLAPRVNATPEQVFLALQRILDKSNVEEPALEALKRIEYEVVKLSPTLCRRVVVVALQQGDSVVLGKLTLDLPWEDLPAELRQEFIRSGKDSQTYLILERAFEKTAK